MLFIPPFILVWAIKEKILFFFLKKSNLGLQSQSVHEEHIVCKSAKYIFPLLDIWKEVQENHEKMQEPWQRSRKEGVRTTERGKNKKNPHMKPQCLPALTAREQLLIKLDLRPFIHLFSFLFFPPSPCFSATKIFGSPETDPEEAVHLSDWPPLGKHMMEMEIMGKNVQPAKDVELDLKWLHSIRTQEQIWLEHGHITIIGFIAYRGETINLFF